MNSLYLELIFHNNRMKVKAARAFAIFVDLIKAPYKLCWTSSCLLGGSVSNKMGVTLVHSILSYSHTEWFFPKGHHLMVEGSRVLWRTPIVPALVRPCELSLRGADCCVLSVISCSEARALERSATRHCLFLC